MKYTVKVADQMYEVEIEDIHARPIVAHVDGQVFEVETQNGVKPQAAREPKEFQLHEPSAGLAGNVKELIAPLPGTIVDIFVRSGEEIEAGHVVLIIEAMKMKNSIRSTRAGKVEEVLVHVGEAVANKQALVTFE